MQITVVSSISSLLGIPISNKGLAFRHCEFSNWSALSKTPYRQLLHALLDGSEVDHYHQLNLPHTKFLIASRKQAIAYDILSGDYCETTKNIYTFYPQYHGGISVIWYLFLGPSYPFFLANDGTKGVDLALYYPSENLAIPLDRGCPKQSSFFDGPIEVIRNQGADFWQYINHSNIEPRVCILQGVCNHWGHVMAQEYPSYSYLSNKIQDLNIIRSGRSFFDYDHLMRSTNTISNHILHFENDREINFHLFSKNLLAFRPTTRDFSFSSFHANSVLSETDRNTSISFKRRIDEILLANASIIAIDIRLNQRVMLNLNEFIDKFVLLVSQKIDSCIFVFTGWTSKGRDIDDDRDTECIKRESRFVSELQSSLSFLNSFSVIGCSPAEKLYIQSKCLFHVTSWGSGLSYYWEICGIPGFVHGNSFVIKNLAKPLISSPSRTGLPAQYFVPLEFVSDYSDLDEALVAQGACLMRYNYRIDVDGFLAFIDSKLGYILGAKSVSHATPPSASPQTP